jgi:pSer/pThr/pTyr-binding forkhead associated (FHA) protein
MPTPGEKSDPRAVPALNLRTPDGRVFRFEQPFHIGRDHDCEVRIQDVHVSRRHVLVSFDEGHWRVTDLKSANGVFVNGQRVETVVIEDGVAMTLGADGPCVTIDLGREGVSAKRSISVQQTVAQPDSETRLLASYAERYFGSKASQGQGGGRRTLMIRKAFEQVQKQQKRKHARILAIVALAGLAAGVYAIYKHRQMSRQQAVAQEWFYQMKALDVDLANIERKLATSGSAQDKDQVVRLMARRQQLEDTYDRFLSALNLYDQRLSEEDRLILRVTRLFGECELAAPQQYLKLVKTYIKRWQSSDRFGRAVKLAQQMGYTKTIADEFLSQNLPPHFFYLAMQESDFDALASGPPTYMGFAKGMWQFVPDTGARYGLTIGPLAKFPRPDLADDRHNWQKATKAAARYIKDIYATDAQASGLLVMASYNWGEGRVIKLLRSMPENPQERNFWQVLEKHHDRVPRETYDYVFYIVSAAVIGENPRLFGLPFDSPLEFLEKK